MGNLLSGHGKSKKQQITDADRAVLSLKTQRKKLSSERQRVEGLADKDLQTARELVALKKQDRALLALKRKKLREHQLADIDKCLLNVEAVLLDIQAANRTGRLIDTLKQGNNALKALQSQLSVEEVEQLLEDSADAKAHEERIRELLGDTLQPEEEDAALSELEALESTILQEEAEAMPKVPQVVTADEEIGELPEVPTTAVAAQKQAANPEPVAQLAS